MAPDLGFEQDFGDRKGRPTGTIPPQLHPTWPDTSPDTAAISDCLIINPASNFLTPIPGPRPRYDPIHLVGGY